MKTFRFISGFIFLSIFVALILTFTPSTALAGGAGPEPGAGCPAAGERLGYVPPPFIGDVELHWNNDLSIDVSSLPGGIPQVGNPDCILHIYAEEYYTDVGEDDWNNLRPVDLRQRCLVNDPPKVQFSFTENCSQEFQKIQFAESVGVGNLRDDEMDSNRKIARVIVMGLQP